MKRSRKIVTVPEDEHGMTALHFAALYDKVAITKLLLQSVSSNFTVIIKFYNYLADNSNNRG